MAKGKKKVAKGGKKKMPVGEQSGSEDKSWRGFGGGKVSDKGAKK